MGPDGSREKTISRKRKEKSPVQKKKKQTKNIHQSIDSKPIESALASNPDEDLYKAKPVKKKSLAQKRRNKEKRGEAEAVKIGLRHTKEKNEVVKEKSKMLRVKKRRIGERNEVEVSKVHEIYNDAEDVINEQDGADVDGEKKSSKLRKKKKKNEKKKEDVVNEQDGADVAGEKKRSKLRKKKKKNEKKKEDIGKVDELYNEVENGFDAESADRKVGERKSEDERCTQNAEHPKDSRRGTKTRKSKKAKKINKKDGLKLTEDDHSLEKGGEAEEEVYQLSSGDEDCSRGMKKWIEDYYQSRPGLDILQQRIDDFITDHEAQEEQAREEREAQAAEGGWTVVVHHKGRKKTTDAESGVTVGSAAPAAIMDKMAKKKGKEVGLDFYRFQKREAQRNEIMMLQSKFEQDKKRIQQLRAARKFRPY